MSRNAESPSAGPLASRIINTPVGRLQVGAAEHGVCCVRFGAGRSGAAEARPRRRAAGRAAAQHLDRACRELGEYFAGERTRFEVPLDLSHGTPFQRAVWRACARIPFGEVRSYGELAKMAGHPRAARAVGNAMNANPIPILVPCHRVIRADGSLGGFGSGLSLKRKLLELECR